MTQSLCGKDKIQKNNLLGKNISLQKDIPQDIKQLKIKIMNNIILPLISRQWSQLYENRFFLDGIKIKLDYYYKLYKLEDLLLYKNIIYAFELMLNEHFQLSELEKQIYKTNEFTSIVYKTAMIKLKPEYELYDTILGKPKREKNQSYNDSTILYIQHLLAKENMTFQKIKEQVLLQCT
uniref:Uncharacterized protein n=1 Tax=viral metagenome TaxID=1070528 RepID=A0A6C0B9Y6_9ZZZZ